MAKFVRLSRSVLFLSLVLGCYQPKQRPAGRRSLATVRLAGQLLKSWEVLDMSDNSAFQMELIRTREAMERRLRELDKQEQSTTAPVYLLIPLTEEQRERIVRIAEGK